MEHELKTDPLVWNDVAAGKKTWEIRKNDRDFHVNDTLYLRQIRYTGEQMANGSPLEYTGQQIRVRVSYILNGPIYGLKTGWCVMSILSV